MGGDKMRITSALVLSAATLCLAACATNGIPVTGKNSNDPTWKGGQSETSIAVSNFSKQTIITVAYNDEDPAQGKIDYTPTTRTVHSGASLAGWSYSKDRGQTWTYGGTVTPSNDWPVLWGDPAVVASGRDQSYVFMSTLAVPKSLFPAGGTISGPLHDFIGGACIARSTDGGQHFTLYQCVNQDFDFYDGGNMASSTAGDIYAAYIDVDHDRYDIWHASSETGQFTKLPDPFPTCTMATHPRIRVGYPPIGLGAPDVNLYVAGQIVQCQAGTLGKDPGAFGQVIINRYHNGSWGTPRIASNPSSVNPQLQLSDRKLRTGPQFSFDVGAPSVDENGKQRKDEIRVMVTRSGAHFWVEGSFCDFELSGPCHPAPEWGSTPGFYNYAGDQFGPLVRAFPGFALLQLEPSWQASFNTRDHDPSGNTVSTRRGTLFIAPNGTRALFAFDLDKPRLVCSDSGATRGYWGDYDDLQFIGFKPNSTTAQFLRTFTDSSAGCTERWTFTSAAVHVSSLAFP
jgi:hypothetical protein